MAADAETGHVGMAMCVVGALGYLVTIALPDDGTGFWGVVCDVLTLWGWGPLTSLGLVVLFGLLALSVRFARPLVVPMVVAAAVASAPVLVVVVLVATLFDSASSSTSSEF